MLEHQIGVGRFAGLRNGDHQSAFQVERRAVKRVDGRSGKRNGNAGNDFEQVAAKLGSII